MTSRISRWFLPLLGGSSPGSNRCRNIFNDDNVPMYTKHETLPVSFEEEGSSELLTGVNGPVFNFALHGPVRPLEDATSKRSIWVPGIHKGYLRALSGSWPFWDNCVREGSSGACGMCATSTSSLPPDGGCSTSIIIIIVVKDTQSCSRNARSGDRFCK